MAPMQQTEVHNIVIRGPCIHCYGRSFDDFLKAHSINIEPPGGTSRVEREEMGRLFFEFLRNHADPDWFRGLASNFIATG